MGEVMKRFFLLAVAMGVFSQTCLGVIFFLFDAPYDERKARGAILERPELKALQDDYNKVIETRISTLGISDFTAIFGPPIKSNGSMFGSDTSLPPPPHPAGLALPLFAPVGAGISGLHSTNAADNRDHIDLHAIGGLGYLEVYYSIDGTNVQQAVLYLRADQDFVPLKSTNDFAPRLAWDEKRFAAVKNWLDARLPPPIDLGTIRVLEVSPLPETGLKPGQAHQFKYEAVFPTRVSGGGLTFNISAKEEPFSENKFTNHCVEVRMAGVPGQSPVFSRPVTPGRSVVFRAHGEVFVFTPDITNIGCHREGDYNALPAGTLRSSVPP